MSDVPEPSLYVSAEPSACLLLLLCSEILVPCTPGTSSFPEEALKGPLASCVFTQLEAKFKAVTTDTKRKVTWEIEQQFGNSTNKNDCICKQPGQLKAAVGGGNYKTPALSVVLRSTHTQAEASRLPSVFWIFSLKPTCLPLPSISHGRFYFQFLWAAVWHLSGWLLTFIRLRYASEQKKQLNRTRCQRPGAWWSLPLICFQVCLCTASAE